MLTLKNERIDINLARIFDDPRQASLVLSQRKRECMELYNRVKNEEFLENAKLFEKSEFEYLPIEFKLL